MSMTKKRRPIVSLILFVFLGLLVSLTPLQASDKKAATPTGKQSTFSEKIVDFIKMILGEKPKPIDENLVRDEV